MGITSMLRRCIYVTIHSQFHPFSLLGSKRRITCISCAYSKHGGKLKHDQSRASSRLFLQNDDSLKFKQNLGHVLQDCDISFLKHLSMTRRKVDSMINQISISNAISNVQSLFLLRCCGNHLSDELPKKKTEIALKIWKKLEDIGVSLGIRHYNALLNVHLENKHPFSPIEFLMGMQKKNIKPDKVTCQRLIAAHCSEGDIDGAFFILDEMKRLDLPVGKPVFDALVTGYSLNGDFEKVDHILATMSQLGIKPDHETYRSLLCSHAAHNRIEHIVSTLSKCRDQGILLYDSDLLSVVFSAAKNGHINLVDSLLVRMSKCVFYNQHCVDVILRLTNQKLENAAFKVLLTMERCSTSTGQPLDVFFIRHIVKLQYPPQKIMDFCQQLVDMKLNPHAHIIAYDSAHAFLHCDLILALMSNSKLGKLAPEHFWPLLDWQSKINNESSGLIILNQMASLGVNPNIETVLRVLPQFGYDATECIFSKLLSASVPPSVAVGSLLILSLRRDDFRGALEKASRYRFRLDKPVLYEAAARAYSNTLDATSLAKLIRLLLDKHASEMSSEELVYTSEQVVSHLINQVLNSTQETKIDHLQLLLEALLSNRLYISQESRQLLQLKLADRLTLPIENLLMKLSREPTTNVSVLKLDTENEPKKPFDILIDNINQSQKLGTLTSIYHQMRLKSSSNDENSKRIFRILYLAKLLVETDHGEVALEMLEQLNEEKKNRQYHPFEKPHAAARHLMDVAVLKGDINLVQHIHQSLSSSSLFVMDSDLLSPLIKVHMQRNDLQSALMAFEQCATTFFKTPLLTELLVQFIQRGDLATQQHIIDIGSQVHNEKKCLHYHAFAYLQCGLVNPARILFKTPGLRAYATLIEEHCLQCLNQNKDSELSNLINITKELFGVDRHRLYQYLLTIYINNDDTDKVQTICTRMEEEGIKPSKNFLARRTTFLQSSNRPVKSALEDRLPVVHHSAPTKWPSVI